MNAKKVVPLLISLVCAGLVLVAMKFYGRQASSLIPAKGLQVVVAKTNVDAGTALTADNLTLGEIAGQKAPDTSFTDPSEVVGRVLSVPLVQGQVVTATLLTPKGTIGGLPALVPDGFRAVTLDINEITGIAGYITPGCHIDIMQTVRLDSNTNESITRTIAQNVKVLACGMKHGPDGGDGGGRSITVLCTPEQAELFELAAANGRSRMSLRGSNDLAREDIKPVSLIDLRGKSGNVHDPLIRPVVVTSNPPTTMPTIVQSTTRPSIDVPDDTWTIHVVNGPAETDVKFKLHNEGTEDSDVRVSPAPVFDK